MNPPFEEVIAQRLKEEENLAIAVRKEIRANRYSLIAMHMNDGVRVIVKSTMDALLVIATVFVWGWLIVPGSMRSIASATASDGIGSLAGSLFIAVFVFSFAIRFDRDELTRTYDQEFDRSFFRRKERQDTVRLIEAVLEQHGLIAK